MSFSDKIKGYTGQNPFSDSQARNFSDEKLPVNFYRFLYFGLYLMINMRFCWVLEDVEKHFC